MTLPLPDTLTTSHPLTVVGAGYVGLTLATGLATHGHKVLLVEACPHRLAALQQGVSPLAEVGLQEAYAKVWATGQLTLCPHAQWQPATDPAVVVFIAVGTPTEATSPQLDTAALWSVVRHIAQTAQSTKGLVIKSTIPVGTTQAVAEFLAEQPPHLPQHSVAHMPEFLSQGQAWHDTLHPQRLVIGTEDASLIALLRHVFSPWLAQGNVPWLAMSPASAEVGKLAANATLASRVAMTNTLHSLVQATPTAHWPSVAQLLQSDARLAGWGWQPSLGFGGSCLPKDTLALAQHAHTVGVEPTMLDATLATNSHRLANTLATLNQWRQQHPNPVIGVLGLTFKAGSDDLRASAAMALVQAMLAQGMIVLAHDPTVTAERLALALPQTEGLQVASSAQQVLAQAGAIVLATPWPLYLKPDLWQGLPATTLVIDVGQSLPAPSFKSAPWPWLTQVSQTMQVS